MTTAARPVGGAAAEGASPRRPTPAPAGRIAFLPVRDLHLPHNNREFYLSRELARRGWHVSWLRPRGGTNRGVPIEWEVLEHRELDVRGRKYFFPAYLAGRLLARRIRLLWLSGWTMRDPEELQLLTRTLSAAGIRIIYDPIDPICEFAEAQGQLRAPGARERCRQHARRIHDACALITCVTPEIADLLAAAGVRRDHLYVARWGTDGELFDAARVHGDLKRRLGLSAHTFLAGWLGTMEPFKGLQEVVLPLVERMAAAGAGIHFVIAGRGTLEPDIRAWAQSRPELPVSVLPSVAYEDAPAFTASLDAYLVPTNPETDFAQAICPVKCFDALAMGTPLIVSRTRATAFLGRHADLVSFADFDAASFEAALLSRVRSARTAPRSGVKEYTHQAVSIGLADAIAALRPGSGAATLPHGGTG